jgi:hypothetical protein
VLLSDFGGFLEIIFFITVLIVNNVQTFYFQQRVIKNIYMENGAKLNKKRDKAGLTMSMKDNKLKN